MNRLSYALNCDGRSRLLVWWLLALAAGQAAGCAIDDEDACSENQVLKASDDFRVCVCDEAHGYVFDSAMKHGCKRCGKGMVVHNGACVAQSGGATGAVDGGADASAADAAAGEDAASEPLPTGLGASCSSNADCAAFDATFCDSFMSHSCLVEKCATGENACPGGWACCDFSALLSGLSICTPEDQLSNGECPMGGMRVEP